MLDFLKLLGLLVLMAAKYVFTAVAARLRPLYSTLAQRITKRQSAFIIWPISLAFVLSYPSLYSLYSAPQPPGCSYITNIHATGIVGGSAHMPGLVLKQLWLVPSQTPTPNYFDLQPGALAKPFLEDVFAVQQVLLDGIPLNATESVFVHSPLQFWDHDLEKLHRDRSPVKTINKKIASPSSGVGISYTGLISNAVKVNGVVKSADAIRIMMMYIKGQTPTDYGTIWDANLARLKDTTDVNFTLTSDADEPSEQQYVVRLTRMGCPDHFILALSYLLMTIYFLVSLSNLSSVKSKLGLLVAFVVEMALAMLSAATLTTYLFQEVDFFEIPLQFLPFVVVVAGIENMFRLMATLAKTPGENSVSYRISKTLETCGVTSTFVVVGDLVILAILYPFVIPSSQMFCIFAAFALVIEHALHLTYFVAVLSIDIHRLELHDLIDADELQKKKTWLELFYGSESSLDGDTRRTSNGSNVFKKVLGTMDKMTLPLSTNVAGSIVSVLFLIGTNIRWMGSRLSVPFFGSSVVGETLSASHIANVLDKRIFRGELTVMLDSETLKSASELLITVDRPMIGLQGPSLGTLPTSFSLETSYRFDIYYILEFLTLLTFILSLAIIALKYFTSNMDMDDDEAPMKKIAEMGHTFQSKVLSGGHFLDVIKITTSRSHFIVSVGLDHKVLVWSPISQPMPLPMHLPMGSGLWPITNVVLSDHGNYVALLSKSGNLQCWSRLSMAWVWKLHVNELKNALPLESYFRHKTVPAFLKRKKANELLMAAAAASRPSSRRNSMRSIASPNMGPSQAFDNNSGVSNELEELVLVLRSGEIVTISCQDGIVSKDVISPTPLVSCVKLLTPRVNDRLVSCNEVGDILVSTAVNNKWKTRKVVVDNDRFNNPERSQIVRPGMSSLPSTLETGVTEETPPPSPQPSDFNESAIAIVPFVGFIVRTANGLAELIDIQTGIVIKRFKIRHFKKGSFRVFHDQPTHCRFCGSASIASFSVVYTVAGAKTVAMHTFTVDHRAKTSICLRVERDPREIRCIGFNLVTEHQYEFTDVDGWCVTDKNQIMGIKRKSPELIQKSIDDAKHAGLRKRHQSSQRHFTDETAPKLNNLWEGWTMDAFGKVDAYDIPDVGNADGLLVNSVGQIARFGHKSIVVAFGNIMKVLYLGNDDLVFQDDERTANDDISGLTFVNKRRRNLKKQSAGSSMNFGEVDTIPGISELAL